jgi:hypothetical protein
MKYVNFDRTAADGTPPIAWLEADFTAAQARGA